MQYRLMEEVHWSHVNLHVEERDLIVQIKFLTTKKEKISLEQTCANEHLSAGICKEKVKVLENFVAKKEGKMGNFKLQKK